MRAALPQLIVGFTARPQVVPRMLPFLTGAALYWLLQAASVGALLSLAVSLVTMAAIWPFTAGLNGRRPPRLTLTGLIAVGVLYGAVFAVGGPVIHAVRLGTFSRGLGPAGLIVFAAVFAGGYVATAYGVVAALRHALGDLAQGLADLPRSFGRSLPVVLFGTLFLFFTGELWQLLDRLAWPRVWLVVALLAILVGLATWRVVKGYDEDPVGPPPTPEELAEACAGTPLAGLDVTPAELRPLGDRQALNVLVLLTVRQLVQAAIIGLGLFLFFVALGLITVQYETAATWIGHDPQRSALLGVPVALFKLAALLAAFGGVSFSTTSMTNADYRHEFFEPALRGIRRPILVHSVYRALVDENVVREP